MTTRLYCEFCDKVNVPKGYENVKIFTQKCDRCNKVSINKIVQATNKCIMCEQNIVTNKGETCHKCKETNIKCLYCNMIPKTFETMEGGTIICGICKRKFHPQKTSKAGKIIPAHLHEGEANPSVCSICNQ